MLELTKRCAQEAPEVLDGDGIERIRESEADSALMQSLAAQAIVLLKNDDALLPLKPKVRCPESAMKNDLKWSWTIRSKASRRLLLLVVTLKLELSVAVVLPPSSLATSSARMRVSSRLSMRLTRTWRSLTLRVQGVCPCFYVLLCYALTDDTISLSYDADARLRPHY